MAESLLSTAAAGTNDCERTYDDASIYDDRKREPAVAAADAAYDSSWAASNPCHIAQMGVLSDLSVDSVPQEYHSILQIIENSLKTGRFDKDIVVCTEDDSLTVPFSEDYTNHLSSGYGSLSISGSLPTSPCFEVLECKATDGVAMPQLQQQVVHPNKPVPRPRLSKAGVAAAFPPTPPLRSNSAASLPGLADDSPYLASTRKLRSLPPSLGGQSVDLHYRSQLEFARKRGFSEEQLRSALAVLGSSADMNDLLSALIQVHSARPPSRTLSDDVFWSSTHSLPEVAQQHTRGYGAGLEPAKSGSTGAAIGEHKDSDDELRGIVIDGSNVAMSHGNKQTFSCRGIQIAVDWFRQRGHKHITVFVPQWRKETSHPMAPIADQHVLDELEREKIVAYTPSRRVHGRRVVCYDDRFILKLAALEDAVVVSNDNYRDLIKENPAFKRVVEERLLMYTFVNDRFMPPDDPLGRYGPSLDTFLRKPASGGRTDGSGAWRSSTQACPYGRKCTYGSKCKYYHPERLASSAAGRAELRVSPTPSQSPARVAQVRSAGLDGKRPDFDMGQKEAHIASLIRPPVLRSASYGSGGGAHDRPGGTSPLIGLDDGGGSGDGRVHSMPAGFGFSAVVHALGAIQNDDDIMRECEARLNVNHVPGTQSSFGSVANTRSSLQPSPARLPQTAVRRGSLRGQHPQQLIDDAIENGVCVSDPGNFNFSSAYEPGGGQFVLRRQLSYSDPHLSAEYQTSLDSTYSGRVGDVVARTSWPHDQRDATTFYRGQYYPATTVGHYADPSSVSDMASHYTDLPPGWYDPYYTDVYNQPPPPAHPRPIGFYSASASGHLATATSDYSFTDDPSAADSASIFHSALTHPYARYSHSVQPVEHEEQNVSRD